MIALLKQKYIGGVILCMLTSSVVDCGHKPWSGQTKDYEIGICCLSAKHATLRIESTDCFAEDIIMCLSGGTQTVVSVN
jgi:hypothetical protein